MAVDVSVGVLTYNQEKTIARTLDSILNQRHTCTFEIIIGDDCSSDDTRKICEEYGAAINCKNEKRENENWIVFKLIINKSL